MRILIAEDESTSRKILTAQLEKWGYQPLPAADGLVAWEIMQLPDPPRLALIDWMMPGLDGLELCRRIRARSDHPAPYLIILTSKGETANLINGLDAGADDYITKPYNQEELHARIRAGIRTIRQQQLQVAPIFCSSPETGLPKVPVVLVIEDHKSEMDLIRHQLHERDPRGFTIYSAESLAAARHLVTTEGIRPDAVLLELNLPDSQGVNTVKRCQTIIDTPIVVLSGQESHTARQLALEAGADDFLIKGGDAVGLRRAIRYAIIRHRRNADLRLAATVIQHAREGIAITRPDGTIIEVNEAFYRITGYQRDEVIGKNPRMLKSGRHGPEFYHKMWQALSSDGYWSGEIWNRHKHGRVFPEMLTISAVPDSTGATVNYVALFSDISQLKEQQRQLEQIAHFDALTGLPNRVLLADRLNQAMARTLRRGTRLAVAFLDLDGFKAINDNHGHDAGDCLLCTLAVHMQQALRESDTLARQGGDEFVAIIEDMPDNETCLPLLRRLLQASAQRVNVQGIAMQVSASLGVTFYPQSESIEADQLLRQADQAMYQAKQAGKNRYQIFKVA